MASKAELRRRKKTARTVTQTAPEVSGVPKQANATPQGRTARPTAERMEHGYWAMPAGPGKEFQPAVDLAADMVGWLHVTKQITTSQEQSARAWQELRERYIAELPEVQSYKSCLAGSVPGYDDGDGNPAVIAAYRRLERAMTLPQRREMLHVCDSGYKPTNIDTLRGALDAIGGA